MVFAEIYPTIQRFMVHVTCREIVVVILPGDREAVERMIVDTHRGLSTIENSCCQIDIKQ
jgi:hypothetical protein